MTDVHIVVILERNVTIMLYVLQTQLHSHRQPSADFLAQSPQDGYNNLLASLQTQHVTLPAPTRISLPHSQEEWIEEATWIQVALDHARTHHAALLIYELQSGANQFYDFRTQSQVMPVDMPGDLDDLVAKIADETVYFGAYDQPRRLRQNGGAYYNLEPVFIQNSGRLVDTFQYDRQNQQSFFKQLLFRMSSISSMSDHSDIFLKSQASKRYTERFSYDEIVAALNQPERSSDKMMNLAYSSEVYSSFIITNFIEMHDEHRFFVINNKIIDGSRTVGSYTPVKNGALGYQQNMRRYAGHVNQELYHFASKMVQEIAATSKTLREQPYVIDVAYHDRQEPIIVEFNPFFNSGLYSTNPRLLLDALL